MGRRNTKNKHKSNIKEQNINTILLKNRVFRWTNYRKNPFRFSCHTSVYILSCRTQIYPVYPQVNHTPRLKPWGMVDRKFRFQ